MPRVESVAAPMGGIWRSGVLGAGEWWMSGTEILRSSGELSAEIAVEREATLVLVTESRTGAASAFVIPSLVHDTSILESTRIWAVRGSIG